MQIGNSSAYMGKILTWTLHICKGSNHGLPPKRAVESVEAVFKQARESTRQQRTALKLSLTSFEQRLELT